MLNDNPDTCSLKWMRDQSDRLMSFEILRRHVLHETDLPLSIDDLYDNIGVSRTFLQRLIKSIPSRLDE